MTRLVKVSRATIDDVVFSLRYASLLFSGPSPSLDTLCNISLCMLMPFDLYAPLCPLAAQTETVPPHPSTTSRRLLPLLAELGLSSPSPNRIALSESFPPELLYCLVEHCSRPTLAALCLVSSSVRAIASPRLYRSMVIQFADQLDPFLGEVVNRVHEFWILDARCWMLVAHCSHVDRLLNLVVPAISVPYSYSRPRQISTNRLAHTTHELHRKRGSSLSTHRVA